MNYIAQLAEVEFFILHPSSFILAVEARGGVEPRAVPPDSYRFGLEDRCRERGPELEATVRFESRQVGTVYGTAALPVGATSPFELVVGA